MVRDLAMYCMKYYIMAWQIIKNRGISLEISKKSFVFLSAQYNLKPMHND